MIAPFGDGSASENEGACRLQPRRMRECDRVSSDAPPTERVGALRVGVLTDAAGSCVVEKRLEGHFVGGRHDIGELMSQEGPQDERGLITKEEAKVEVLAEVLGDCVGAGAEKGWDYVARLPCIVGARVKVEVRTCGSVQKDYAGVLGKNRVSLY